MIPVNPSASTVVFPMKPPSPTFEEMASEVGMESVPVVTFPCEVVYGGRRVWPVCVSSPSCKVVGCRVGVVSVSLVKKGAW